MQISKSYCKYFQHEYFLKLNKNVLIKSINAFTLMEMMITMVVMAILMAVSAPMISQMLITKTGTDKNVLGCITANNTAAWYNTTTGATTVPNSASDPKCYIAVTDVQNDRGKALNTAVWYSDNGNDTQKTVAKQILRAACDQGGHGACDYFINKCWTSGSASAPYCDDTTSFTDLTYYLHNDADKNTNLGASYILTQLEGLLPKMSENLINEVTYACGNNQLPNSHPANQNLNKNFGCRAGSPKLFIQACNRGHAGACKTAYDNNYNRSCTAVKANWSDAPSGNYQLAADGDPGAGVPVRQVNCNMTSFATAAITGCGVNGSTPVIDDCDAGYKNQYNLSCPMIYTYLSPPVEATYNLTSYGDPHAVITPTDCNMNAACIAGGNGKLCDDGTIYLGQAPDGHYIFVTPGNQPNAKWATNAITELTGINDPDNGAWNTAQLVARVSDFAPYKAANLCNSLNDSNYLGHNDWFLGAKNEMLTVLANNHLFGTAALAYNIGYWVSTEVNAINAIRCYRTNEASAATTNSTTPKDSSYHVRCIRKSVAQDPSCPNIGDTCSNNSVYAGEYNGHIYMSKANQSTGIAWTNGQPRGTVTGTSNPDYGMLNQIRLTTEPATSYPDAPYTAALACKALNDANGGLGTSFDGGNTYYKDWYLPAKNELQLWINNKTSGSIAGTYVGTYWSSTEGASYTAHGGGTSLTTYSKTVNYNVRCMRRFW